MLNTPNSFAIRSRASNWPSPRTQSPEWFEIFAWILGSVSKTSLETFWQTELKICGNEYSLLILCSIPYRNQAWFAVQTKWYFYVKYNTRLKYNNATPFFLNNYLLKCAQHMLDVSSTENLSLHHKILIGIKNHFDLHKLLQIFYENKICTLRLVFLLMFFFLLH